MNIEKILKFYYYFLGLASLTLISVFFKINNAENLVKFASKFPKIFTALIALFMLWTLLTFVTAVILLFSPSKREKMFLIITNAEAKDELEEKSVNESVKSVFFLNIVLCVLAVALSSIGRHEITKKDGEIFTSFTYNIPLTPADGKKDLREVFEKIESETSVTPKSSIEVSPMRVEFAESLKVKASFLPKRFFSTYGLMCFIILQFLFFRVFLYFHRKSIFN